MKKLAQIVLPIAFLASAGVCLVGCEEKKAAAPVKAAEKATEKAAEKAPAPK